MFSVPSSHIILFAEPSDGDDGRFGVPEDKLDADPAARGAVNQPPAATYVPFAGDGERIAVDAPTSRQHKVGMERWLQTQEKRVKETAAQFQERKRKREEEKKEEEQRRQRRAADAAARQAAAAPAARPVTEPVAAAPVEQSRTAAPAAVVPAGEPAERGRPLLHDQGRQARGFGRRRAEAGGYGLPAGARGGRAAAEGIILKRKRHRHHSCLAFKFSSSHDLCSCALSL